MCLLTPFSKANTFCSRLKKKRQERQLRKCLYKAGISNGPTRTNPPLAYPPINQDNGESQQDEQNPKPKVHHQTKKGPHTGKLVKPSTGEKNTTQPQPAESHPTQPNSTDPPVPNSSDNNTSNRLFGSESTMGGLQPRPASEYSRQSQDTSTSSSLIAEPEMSGLHPRPASEHRRQSQASFAATTPVTGPEIAEQPSISLRRVSRDGNALPMDPSSESTNQESANVSIGERSSPGSPHNDGSSNENSEPVPSTSVSGAEAKSSKSKRGSTNSQVLIFDDDDDEPSSLSSEPTNFISHNTAPDDNQAGPSTSKSRRRESQATATADSQPGPSNTKSKRRESQAFINDCNRPRFPEFDLKGKGKETQTITSTNDQAESSGSNAGVTRSQPIIPRDSQARSLNTSPLNTASQETVPGSDTAERINHRPSDIFNNEGQEDTRSMNVLVNTAVHDFAPEPLKVLNDIADINVRSWRKRSGMREIPSLRRQISESSFRNAEGIAALEEYNRNRPPPREPRIPDHVPRFNAAASSSGGPRYGASQNNAASSNNIASNSNNTASNSNVTDSSNSATPLTVGIQDQIPQIGPPPIPLPGPSRSRKALRQSQDRLRNLFK